jgi:hypothetical protein
MRYILWYKKTHSIAEWEIAMKKSKEHKFFTRLNIKIYFLFLKKEVNLFNQF